MVIDEVTKFYHHGKFEEALDLLDTKLVAIEPGTSEFFNFTKLKSKIYYHLGRGDQAVYYINELMKYHVDLELKTSKAIYLFGQGHILEAKSIINSITEEELNRKEDESNGVQNYFGLSNYYYFQGLITEFDGDLEKSLLNFEEALEFRELIDDRYETNVIYYKIATIYRQLGNLTSAKTYLEKSLKLSKELDLIKEIATTATLLGQDYLMQSMYDTAIPYLKEGVENWEEVGSPFGIIWALSEMAIVDFLSGNTASALKNYNRIIEMGEEVIPPFFYSSHLLNGVRFAIIEGQLDRAKILLEKLEHLSKTEENQHITARANFAEVLVNKTSNRIGVNLKSKKILEELSNEASELLLNYEAILEDIDLLLLEYKITEETTVKEEILDEADTRLQGLLDHIRLRMGISFEVRSAVLRSKIDALKFEPSEIKSMLEDILTNSQVDISALNNQISELLESNSNDDITFHHEFDFDKEFQSIPTLKILLYLLPRGFVSFSDLEKGTGLSAGHLSGKCQRLENLDYITKEKSFIEEKFVTTFSMTPLGYLRLKQYMKNLSTYLGNIF